MTIDTHHPAELRQELSHDAFIVAGLAICTRLAVTADQVLKESRMSPLMSIVWRSLNSTENNNTQALAANARALLHDDPPDSARHYSDNCVLACAEWLDNRNHDAGQEALDIIDGVLYDTGTVELAPGSDRDISAHPAYQAELSRQLEDAEDLANLSLSEAIRKIMPRATARGLLDASLLELLRTE